MKFGKSTAPPQPLRALISWVITSLLKLKSFSVVLVVLLIPIMLICIGWVMTKEIRHTDMQVSRYIYNEARTSIKTAATVFSLLNSSALNIARFVRSSLNETQPSLSHFEIKVAPFLFLAFKTLPIAQITYMGSNGLFFSYYNEGNQTLAMFANTSNIESLKHTQNASIVYRCYTQPADNDTGRRFSDLGISNSTVSINSTWFQEVLNSSNGHASLGTGWSGTHEQLILNTAAPIGGGLVSLGFPVKAFTNESLTKEDFYSAIKDGPLRTMQYNSSFPVLFYSSASILDFHHKRFARLVFKHSKLVLTVAILLLTSVALYASFITFLFLRTTRREVLLYAALFKQVEAAQQAERKSMNKSAAFASASHDVRSSLAALDGLISLCRAEVAPHSEIYTNLEQMRELAADLLGILNSILDTSKIEAGKMQLAEEEFDVAQVLEDVVNLYNITGKDKGIDVILDPCDGSLLECSQVKGDRGKLKQILNNLLHNAMKFTSEGRISVRAWLKKPSSENLIPHPNSFGFQNFFSSFFYKKSEVHRDLNTLHVIQQQQNSVELVIEVDDTGKGIPKEKHKSVFEDFVQVKESALEKGGTGLGLGIVKLLVQLMGGDISIVDKELGEKGTCFRFNIFLSKSEAAPITIAKDTELLSDWEQTNFYQNLQQNILNRSPSSESSCVVLFVNGDWRRRTIQKFMESHRINTWTLDRLEQLSPTLEQIKHRQYLPRLSSSRNFELGSLNFTSFDFNGWVKDWPMDVEEGTSHTVATQRKASSKSKQRTILMVIDLSAAHFNNERFSKVCSMLADFRKDLNDSECKIVWLYTPSPDFESRRLDEGKLAQCEHIITKPFHGFQLYQVLRLLPEFGGASTIQHYRGKPTKNIEQIPTDPSVSTQMNHNKSDSGILKSSQPQNLQREAPNHDKPLHGKKILVAEDQPVLRKVAKRILDQLGASIELCENGEEALKAVCKALKESSQSTNSSVPYNYILMDCEMPIMNGYEATRRIRMEERVYGIHIPIIALTAHAQNEDHADMMVAGMDFHLTKPLAVEKLLKVIRSLDSNDDKNM